MHHISLSRRLVAELLGTALLLAVVVGSGIMGDRLSGGNVALALLANALATGAGLFALIQIFAPISGAHFNPVVSLYAAMEKHISWREAGLYAVVQIVGAVLGVFAAHLMFAVPLIEVSQHVRAGEAQWWSEFVATFGLLAVIIATSRNNHQTTPVAVAAYITSAYWFTASTAFANPAVTLARTLTATFAGIRPCDAFGFILMQIMGAVAAVVIFRWLLKPLDTAIKRV
ncbi:MAG: aquaporin family protein [Gammaproteobacteria bacterium]|nr:aquaporin family protein [Gammaproteobacteria bacterium]